MAVSFGIKSLALAAMLFCALPVFGADVPKTRLYVFLNAGCPCSSRSVQYLRQIQDDAELSSKIDLDVYDVGDASPEGALKFYLSAKLPFTVHLNRDHEIALKYKPTRSPEFFLVDAGGRTIAQGTLEELDGKPEKFFQTIKSRNVAAQSGTVEIDGAACPLPGYGIIDKLKKLAP